MSSCGCQSEKKSDKNVLIYACSGAANVGEIADRVARRLMSEGKGGMFCLAGVGGQISTMIDTARKADVNLVLDGCPVDCSRRIFENAKLTNVTILRLTDLGITKAKGVPVSDEQVKLVYQAAIDALANA